MKKGKNEVKKKKKHQKRHKTAHTQMLINSEMLVYHPKKLVKSIVHYFLFTILKTGAAQYFMFLEKGCLPNFWPQTDQFEKNNKFDLKI